MIFDTMPGAKRHCGCARRTHRDSFPCVENWVAEGLSGWVCSCWGRILGAHSRPCFEVVEWSSTLAFVFECTTHLLSEPRMRDQSVGRFVPFAGQSFSVMVLSGGGGDLLDIRQEHQ